MNSIQTPCAPGSQLVTNALHPFRADFRPMRSDLLDKLISTLSLPLVSKDDCYVQPSSPSCMAPEVLAQQRIKPILRRRSIWPGVFPIYQSTTIGASDSLGRGHEPNSRHISSMTVSQESFDDMKCTPVLTRSFLCSLGFAPRLSPYNSQIPLPRFRPENGGKHHLSILRPFIFELFELCAFRETASASKELSDIFHHQIDYINELDTTNVKFKRMNSYSGTALAAPWFRIRHRARIRAAQWHTSIL